jgi:nucleotide-binding universal stress UspA family protein
MNFIQLTGISFISMNHNHSPIMKTFSISRILVPMDFSKPSSFALDTAIALSQRQQASLMLLHVVNSASIRIPRTGETTVGPVTELNSLSEEKLRNFCKTLSQKLGIHVDYAVESGVPASVICSYAAIKKSDIIVIGTKKKFGLVRLFKETTTYKVIKNAPCPILSVPATRLFRKFEKIIFPVRAIPNMLDKYDVLRPILNSNSSVLHIAGLTRANDVDEFDDVNAKIETLRRKLQLEQVPYSARIHFCDSISDQLIEISSNEDPDLIVITTRIEYWFKRTFLEYYAKVIVDRAKCPVLSIRPDMLTVN